MWFDQHMKQKPKSRKIPEIFWTIPGSKIRVNPVPENPGIPGFGQIPSRKIPGLKILILLGPAYLPDLPTYLPDRPTYLPTWPTRLTWPTYLPDLYLPDQLTYLTFLPDLSTYLTYLPAWPDQTYLPDLPTYPPTCKEFFYRLEIRQICNSWNFLG